MIWAFFILKKYLLRSTSHKFLQRFLWFFWMVIPIKTSYEHRCSLAAIRRKLDGAVRLYAHSWMLSNLTITACFLWLPYKNNPLSKKDCSNFYEGSSGWLPWKVWESPTIPWRAFRKLLDTSLYFVLKVFHVNASLMAAAIFIFIFVVASLIIARIRWLFLFGH